MFFKNEDEIFYLKIESNLTNPKFIEKLKSIIESIDGIKDYKNFCCSNQIIGFFRNNILIPSLKKLKFIHSRYSGFFEKLLHYKFNYYNRKLLPFLSIDLIKENIDFNEIINKSSYKYYPLFILKIIISHLEQENKVDEKIISIEKKEYVYKKIVHENYKMLLTKPDKTFEYVGWCYQIQ